jgi:hypothetical protein
MKGEKSTEKKEISLPLTSMIFHFKLFTAELLEEPVFIRKPNGISLF